MRNKTIKFENLMTAREALAMLILLPVHVFLLPALIQGYTLSSGNELSPLFSQAVYFGVSFLAVFIFARGFLRRSFDALLDNFGQCTITAASGLFCVMALSYLLMVVFFALDENILSAFDSSAQAPLSGQHFTGLMILGAGVVPLVQETLFRGLIFGALRPKNRVLAYIVSVLAFVLYGVWQLFFSASDMRQIAVTALSAVPQALMCAWAYDRTGSVWTPMLLSALVSVVTYAPYL